jgi:thiol-disulfide isomerase/thioredoxin
MQNNARVLFTCLILIFSLTSNSAKAGKLPDFSRLNFVDSNGDSYSLSDFSGKVILLNIWATWCAPCRHEIPALDKLNQKLSERGGKVILLNVDGGDFKKAENFLKKNPLKSAAPFFDREGQTLQNLNIRGLPVTYIFNPRGNLVKTIEGAIDWSNPEVMDFLMQLHHSPAKAAQAKFPEVKKL